MKRFFKRFGKPASVSGILADLHAKVDQLEEHKVEQSQLVDSHEEAAAAARRAANEAAAEWTQAHHVVGKLKDLLGVQSSAQSPVIRGY